MYAEKIQNGFDYLLEERLQQEINRNFKDGEKLFNDILNEWKALKTLLTLKTKFFDSLKPFLNYQEYYANKSEEDLENLQEEVQNEEITLDELVKIKIYHQTKNQRIMELSDPEAIEQYNQLVVQFNSELNEIITQKNLTKIEDFAEKAQKIVYPEE